MRLGVHCAFMTCKCEIYHQFTLGGNMYIPAVKWPSLGGHTHPLGDTDIPKETLYL